MSRKMAAIRVIKSIEPIEGADRIEKATVDGWTVVVGKGQYKAGQRIIFCEIDSAIPVPRLDPDGSLAKRGVKSIDGDDYHIVRTVRLKGVYSQGLILPLHHLNFTGWVRAFLSKPLGNIVGKDVSRALGIFKYDPFTAKQTTRTAPNLDANLVGTFPTQFARKSDSERVQNLGKHLPALSKYEWVVTEKLDGQSITLINDNGNLRVATRNYEVKDHPVREWAINEGFLEGVPSGFAVQGEWVGPGVNGNTLGLEEHDFRVFDVFKNGELTPHWVTWARDREVPEVYAAGYQFQRTVEVEGLVNHFDGLKSLYAPGKLAEGVVFHAFNAKSIPELGGRSTFKVISNKWLLKHDK